MQSQPFTVLVCQNNWSRCMDEILDCISCKYECFMKAQFYKIHFPKWTVSVSVFTRSIHIAFRLSRSQWGFEAWNSIAVTRLYFTLLCTNAKYVSLSPAPAILLIAARMNQIKCALCKYTRETKGRYVQAEEMKSARQRWIWQKRPRVIWRKNKLSTARAE